MPFIIVYRLSCGMNLKGLHIAMLGTSRMSMNHVMHNAVKLFKIGKFRNTVASVYIMTVHKLKLYHSLTSHINLEITTTSNFYLTICSSVGGYCKKIVIIGNIRR